MTSILVNIVNTWARHFDTVDQKTTYYMFLVFYLCRSSIQTYTKQKKHDVVTLKGTLWVCMLFQEGAYWCMLLYRLCRNGVVTIQTVQENRRVPFPQVQFLKRFYCWSGWFWTSWNEESSNVCENHVLIVAFWQQWSWIGGILVVLMHISGLEFQLSASPNLCFSVTRYVVLESMYKFSVLFSLPASRWLESRQAYKPKH